MSAISLPLRVVDAGDSFEVYDRSGRALLTVPYGGGRTLDRATAQRVTHAACAAIGQAVGEAPPIGDEVDAVLAEFGGDPRAAIAGILADYDTLYADAAQSVSRGFVRGRTLGRR